MRNKRFIFRLQTLEEKAMTQVNMFEGGQAAGTREFEAGNI